MSVTSDAFLAVLVVLTTAAVVFSTLVLPARPRRHPRLGSVVSFVVSLLLCLCLVGTIANRANQWFGTVDDLLAAAPGTGHSPTLAPTPVPGAPLRGEVWRGTPTQLQRDITRTPELDHPLTVDGNGSWHSFTLAGASGVSSRVLVHLPAGYTADPTRFHPVLMAFGGWPTDITEYRTEIALDRRLADLATAGRLRDAIVIIPDVFPGKLDSECVDATVPDGQPWETWLTRDVVGWVTTHLRTIDHPAAWATIGYSAGGFCAAMLALRHPHQFGLAVNLSGTWRPILIPGQEWVRPDDPCYDLAARAADNAPDVGLYASWGESDVEIARQMDAFIPAVRPPTRLVRAPIAGAGHSPQAWLTAMDPALAWLGTASQWFAPVG